ncbi:hypothetical protein ABZV34_34900 [Streptomyces sp. NPDC005195]
MEKSKSEIAAQAGPGQPLGVAAELVEPTGAVRIEDVEDEGP